MLAFFFLLVVLVLPQSASAQIDVGQGDWLSGQNAMMLELVITNAEQLAEMTAAVENIRQVVRAANEGVSLARTAYREYKALRSYSWRDLVHDAKAGLYKAFPHMKQIEQDFKEIQRQGKYISDGEYGKYWNYYGAHDRRITKTLGKMASWAYQQTIWPRVFPEIFEVAQNDKKFLAPHELRIWQLYEETGASAKMALNKTAWGAFAKKVDDYSRQAEASENLELLAQTAAAQAQVQAASDINELLELSKIHKASEVKAKDVARHLDDGLIKGLEEHGDFLFGLGPK